MPLSQRQWLNHITCLRPVRSTVRSKFQFWDSRGIVMDQDIFEVAQKIKRIRARNDPDHMNQECENANEASSPPDRKSRNRRITRIMLKAWKASRPWLLASLPELKAKGWTRTKLFRAGRYKYPCGPWGLAFSRNWLREDASFSITVEGYITCTWQETTGRVVTQTWRPSV